MQSRRPPSTVFPPPLPLPPPPAYLVADALCGITEFLFALSAGTAHATCAPSSSSPFIVHLDVLLHGPRRDSRRDSCFESTSTINSNRRRVGSLSSRLLSQAVESSKPQIAPSRGRKRERAPRGDPRSRYSGRDLRNSSGTHDGH